MDDRANIFGGPGQKDRVGPPPRPGRPLLRTSRSGLIPVRAKKLPKFKFSRARAGLFKTGDRRISSILLKKGMKAWLDIEGIQFTDLHLRPAPKLNPRYYVDLLMWFLGLAPTVLS
eukprot:SAG11_NODE_1566_length_4673_cov_3.640796_6_plen_116_part_00